MTFFISTVSQTDWFRPFEYQISSVFRYPLKSHFENDSKNDFVKNVTYVLSPPSVQPCFIDIMTYLVCLCVLCRISYIEQSIFNYLKIKKS